MRLSNFIVYTLLNITDKIYLNLILFILRHKYGIKISIRDKSNTFSSAVKMYERANWVKLRVILLRQVIIRYHIIMLSSLSQPHPPTRVDIRSEQSQERPVNRWTHLICSHNQEGIHHLTHHKREAAWRAV